MFYIVEERSYGSDCNVTTVRAMHCRKSLLKMRKSASKTCDTEPIKTHLFEFGFNLSLASRQTVLSQGALCQAPERVSLSCHNGWDMVGQSRPDLHKGSTSIPENFCQKIVCDFTVVCNHSRCPHATEELAKPNIIFSFFSCLLISHSLLSSNCQCLRYDLFTCGWCAIYNVILYTDLLVQLVCSSHNCSEWSVSNLRDPERGGDCRPFHFPFCRTTAHSSIPQHRPRLMNHESWIVT